MIVGVRRDRRFGPVVMVGAGGIFTELLRDTASALAPVGAATAKELLGRLRAAPLLRGTRGRPPVDLEAVAAAIAAVSELAAAHPEISELEVNPLLVSPAGAVRSMPASFSPAPIDPDLPTPRSRSKEHPMDFAYTPRLLELQARAAALTAQIMPHEEACEADNGLSRRLTRRSAGRCSTAASRPSTCRPNGVVPASRCSSRSSFRSSWAG